MLVGAASGLPVVDLVSDQLVVGQQPGVLVRERVETCLVFVLVEWLARVERDEIVDRGRSCIDLPGERCLFRFEVTGFEAFKHEYLFGIISSSMFITWQKAVGGRLESRLRFSNTVVWNNLPLPPVSDDLRAKIIDAGQEVIRARELHPDRSLADHYNPLAMSPELLKAHRNLDRVVDKAFGATKALENNEERLQVLFKRYQEMSSADQLPTLKKSRTSAKE